jgi:multiple sugar transport system substrate-binding protein
MHARKWTIIYLSALLMASMLVALGTAGLPQKKATAQESAELLFGSWDDENGNLRHLAAIEDFNAVYPDIKVEILPNPGGDWHSKVLTWIAAGELPDVYMADSSYIPLYVESGGLEPLQPYIDGENGFDPYEIFYPGVYENGFYQGEPYLLAKDYSTVAIYANKKLLDAAGIAIPEEGWTYDDLLDVAMQLTVDANGNNAASPDFDPENIVQYGMDQRHDWWRGFQTVMYSFGSHTISDDGTTFDGYLNSEGVIAALQWMNDAIWTYHVAPPSEWMAALPSGAMQAFYDGQLAMVFGMGPWFLGQMEEQPDFEYAILPMPTGPGGHHGAVCWAGFGLAPTSDNKDSAWLFLKALGTEIGQRHYSEHALSSMPVFMEEKADHPFWSTFIKEAEYLDSLDDLKSPYYLLCVGEPATWYTAIMGEAGKDMDIAAYINDEVLPQLEQCLEENTGM